MSKNTERGIGLQDGSADGQTGTSATGAPGRAEGGAATDPSRAERAAESPRPAPRADSHPVTLLGVPSPLAERGKVTALGRDVHLPAETHRVATSRPISVPEVTPGPQTAPGTGMAPAIGAGDRSASGPVKPAPAERGGGDSGATVVVARDAVARLTQGLSGPTKAEAIGSTPRRPTSPADRATIDASPLIVDQEPTEETELESGGRGWMAPAQRPSVALGIGIALLLSMVLVSVVRYSTLEEGEEEGFADDSGAPRAAVPVGPPKGPSDQAAPTEDPARAVAAGGAGPATPEAKEERTPVPTRGVNDKDQEPDKQVPAEMLPSIEDPVKEPGRDNRRTATTRTHAASAGARRSPSEFEGATAGNDGTANAKPASSRPANSNPANSPPTSPPSLTPARTSGPTPGATQPYDPDSPLPPAGE